MMLNDYQSRLYNEMIHGEDDLDYVIEQAQHVNGLPEARVRIKKIID